MSRTYRGRRAPGSEYWSRRPGNKHGAAPGKCSKRYANRVERLTGRKECRS